MPAHARTIYRGAQRLISDSKNIKIRYRDAVFIQPAKRNNFESQQQFIEARPKHINDSAARTMEIIVVVLREIVVVIRPICVKLLMRFKIVAGLRVEEMQKWIFVISPARGAFASIWCRDSNASRFL